jgi:hypothetical protein
LIAWWDRQRNTEIRNQLKMNSLLKSKAIPVTWRRESSVGIATGYGLDDQGTGVRVPVGSSIFTSPYRPDRLWGPPNLL